MFHGQDETVITFDEPEVVFALMAIAAMETSFPKYLVSFLRNQYPENSMENVILRFAANTPSDEEVRDFMSGVEVTYVKHICTVADGKFADLLDTMNEGSWIDPSAVGEDPIAGTRAWSKLFTRLLEERRKSLGFSEQDMARLLIESACQ